MGRKPLPKEERKENISLRIKKKYKDELQKHENYNLILEKLIIDYLKKNKIDNK
ncbi:hypothetical protein [Vallitalea guaymasensis]|uniref:hypothetical protein n=1 Tax=Vallitalea guaymasensis TaxID=1185412 RepID=UPI00187D39EC|nr:hypothetical protein [Vallitalea guaymasensis]